MTEEILVRMGLDNRPLTVAMRTLRGRMASMAAPITNLLQSMLAPLSAGGLFIAFKKLSDSVDQIKRIAESAGLSTGLTQDFLNIGKSAGIAGEQIESAMGVFARKLSPGDDAEQKLMALADRLAEMEDPGERARLVVENFGKAGIKMLPVLAQGADGVRKLGIEFGKLGESQIQLIDRADDELGKFMSKVKVGFAGAIFFAKSLFDYVREVRANGDGDFSGKGFAEFMDRKAAAEADAMVSRDRAQRAAALAVAAEEKRLKLSERLSKANELQSKAGLEAIEKQNKALEQQNRIVSRLLDAIHSRATAEKNLAEGFKDRSASTLEDLANGGHWEGSAGDTRASHQPRWVADSPYAGAAQRVLNLEGQAKQARAQGNLGLSDQLTRSALNLRNSIPALSAADQNPLAGLEESAKDSAATSAELLKLAQGPGLKVEPPD